MPATHLLTSKPPMQPSLDICTVMILSEPIHLKAVHLLTSPKHPLTGSATRPLTELFYRPGYLPSYIRTYIHTTYIHTYIHTCIHTIHYDTIRYSTHIPTTQPCINYQAEPTTTSKPLPRITLVRCWRTAPRCSKSFTTSKFAFAAEDISAVSPYCIQAVTHRQRH